MRTKSFVERKCRASLVRKIQAIWTADHGKVRSLLHQQLTLKPLKVIKEVDEYCIYRLGPVNSKSFVGHFFLRIKQIFELKILC